MEIWERENGKRGHDGGCRRRADAACVLCVLSTRSPYNMNVEVAHQSCHVALENSA